MGLRILNNVPVLRALGNLRIVTARVQQSVERLSSGLRINSAADDPAGLMISERFRSEIASLSRAQTNASQGIALAQVADGGLEEISNQLIRMRELALQSANGTLATADRQSIGSEFDGLSAEITRIAQATSFGQLRPIDDAALAVVLQVGVDASTAATYTVSGADATATGLSVNTLAVSSVAGASAALPGLSAALQQVSSLRARFGTAQNALESRVRLLASQVEGATAAESSIRDADLASELSRQTRNRVLQKVGIAALAQANLDAGLVLKLLP